MKTCFKCLCAKPLAEFYKHAMMADGHLNKCKDCTKADVSAHRQANLEKVRAYDKLRGSLSHRVAARKGYAKTPEGRAAHKRALKASKLRFPDRDYARNSFASALRRGRIFQWPVCAVPECNDKPQGHHPDYSRPLDVVWLCPAHHKQAHALVANEPAMKESA